MGWSDLWVSPRVQFPSPGPMLVGEVGFGSVSKDTSTFLGYPFSREKRKGLYPISLPYPKPLLAGLEGLQGSRPGSPWELHTG